MDEFTKKLNSRVEKLRAEGHSLEAIATRAGISRQYLHRLLSGEPQVSLTVAGSIASKLGIKLFSKSR